MKKSIIYSLILSCLFSFQTKKQKTWVAIGDSITYVNDNLAESDSIVSQGYMTMVCNKLRHLSYINKGYNGYTSTRIAKNIESLQIPKADIYTIFLGTNDWWTGITLGDIDDFNQTKNPQTTMGAFRVIIDNLRELNPEATIVIVSPLQRGDFVYWKNYKNNALGSYQNKNGKSLEDLVWGLKKISQELNIPFIDLYHDSGITQKNIINFKRLKDPQTGIYKNYAYPKYIGVAFDPLKDEYPYPKEARNMTYDGLHPSDKGNKVIAKLIIKTFKNLGI
jgi:lysophospholipase L1-like esterase